MHGWCLTRQNENMFTREYDLNETKDYDLLGLEKLREWYYVSHFCATIPEII